MNYLKRRLERRDHLIMEEEEYAEQYEGNVYTSTVINNLIFLYLFFSSFFTFLVSSVCFYIPPPQNDLGRFYPLPRGGGEVPLLTLFRIRHILKRIRFWILAFISACQ
jgi:hypothetical protein